MVQSSECILEQVFMKDWPQSFDGFIIYLKFLVSVGWKLQWIDVLLFARLVLSIWVFKGFYRTKERGEFSVQKK